MHVYIVEYSDIIIVLQFIFVLIIVIDIVFDIDFLST